MERKLLDENKYFFKKIEEEKNEFKCCGPSKLALNLRKRKINEKIGKSRISKSKNPFTVEFGNKELEKLNELSKFLYEQKDIKGIIESLDQLYIFLMNFKDPIKYNYIELSKIIPNLYTKMDSFKDKEIIITKIFDLFDQIIRLTSSYDEVNKYCLILNKQYFQIILSLIDYYQNNNIIIEKIFNFLSILVEKSEALKIYLMTKPGFYFIQAIFSLDTKYPLFFIKLMYSFCFCKNINDLTMKDFEIMFVEKCDKIITLFYDQNHSEPRIVINNSLLFIKLYKCLSFISRCENKDIMDIFLNSINNVTLYEKILAFEVFDKEHLAEEVLIIIGNLYCSTDIKHIQILIESNSYQYVMNELTQRFNKNIILENAAWAMVNFVNLEIYRTIFIKNGYINDLIILLKIINSYEVLNEILSIILNLFNGINGTDIYEFTKCDITGCLVYLLKNMKEPNLLNKILIIIKMLLIKGNPNNHLEKYYKNTDNKITNIYLYQFEYCGLYDVLNNLSIQNKHEIVSVYAKDIIDHFFDNYNEKIIVD